MIVKVKDILIIIQCALYATNINFPIYITLIVVKLFRSANFLALAIPYFFYLIFHLEPSRYDIGVVLNSIVICIIISKRSDYRRNIKVNNMFFCILLANLTFGFLIFSERYYFSVSGLIFGGNGVLLSGNINFYSIGFLALLASLSRPKFALVTIFIANAITLSKGIVFATYLVIRRQNLLIQVFICICCLYISLIVWEYLPDARKDLTAGRIQRDVILPMNLSQILFGFGYQNYLELSHFENILDIYQFMGLIGLIYLAPWFVLLVLTWWERSELFVPYLFLIIYGTLAGHVFDELFASFLLLAGINKVDSIRK